MSALPGNIENPQTASDYCKLGDAFANNRKFGKAMECFQRALAIDPHHLNSLFLGGQVLLVIGNITGDRTHVQESVSYFNRVLTPHPDHVPSLLGMGKAFVLLGQFGQAVEVLKRAVEQEPKNAEIHNWLGQAYAKKPAFELAVEHFRKTVELEPKQPYAWHAMGLVLERMNLLEEAEEALRKGRELEPDEDQFLLPLAKIQRRRGEIDEALEFIERVLASDAQDIVKTAAWNEKGKALDKLKRYDEAFEAFVESQQAAARTEDARQMDRSFFDPLFDAAAWFTTDSMKDWESVAFDDDHKDPIFLLGFPRSGTTLTEQIITSCPDMLGTQEEDIISSIYVKMPELLGRNIAYPDGLATLTPKECSILRAYYWERIATLFGEEYTGKQRVLDKVPMNTVYLGLIHRIFPTAPVLVLLRDPRDVCLSAFMQAFTVNAAMVHFYTIDSTANFYARVMGLYRHFREVLDGHHPMLELRYEDMVQDVEGYARQILDFIGEEWTDEVLRYYEKDKNRHVRTPSYEGVLQPVYSSSVARWKHYASQLKPVLPTLAPFVEAFGYEPS